MKRMFIFSLLIASIGLITYTVSCKKEDKNLPELTTLTVSGITTTKAYCGGIIVSDGGSAITQRGVCWSVNPNPTIADNKTTDNSGSGQFYSTVAGLVAKTTYYIRAYATNDAGTTYGNEKTFATADPNSIVTDVDGNVYHFVTIGTQVWMVENLRATHYRNGDSIPRIIDNSWGGLVKGAYCNYKNDTSAVLGRLYNYYAVIDSRNICPTGWRVPNESDWETLGKYLGGDSVAGKALKETGITNWRSPNSGAINSSGFTGLPGGFRNHAGSYTDLKYYGYWWSVTEYDTTYAWFHYLGYDYYYLGSNINGKEIGYSVRCIKDVP